MTGLAYETLPKAAIACALVALLARCSASPPSDSPEPRGVQMTGIIEESRNAPPYTYLRIRTTAGSAWAAVPLSPVQGGSTVRIVNGVTLRNFDAPGLARRFDSIVFGVIER